MLLAGLKPVISDKIVRNSDPGSQLPPRPSQVPPLNLSGMMPNGGNHGSPALSNKHQSVQQCDLFDDYHKSNPRVSDYLSFENLQTDEMAWENLESDMHDKTGRSQRSWKDDFVSFILFCWSAALPRTLHFPDSS